MIFRIGLVALTIQFTGRRQAAKPAVDAPVQLMVGPLSVTAAIGSSVSVARPRDLATWVSKINPLQPVPL